MANRRGRQSEREREEYQRRLEAAKRREQNLRQRTGNRVNDDADRMRERERGAAARRESQRVPMDNHDLRRKKAQEKRIKAMKRRRRKRIVRLILFLLIFLLLGMTAYAYTKFQKLDRQSIDENNLEIHANDSNYMNIALFGVDTRDDGSVEGSRSDTMMIASVNKKTNDIKIVSVFRDTLSRQQAGDYAKANAAYSYGGPEEAIALLNRNLDMNIKRYVTVDFKVVVQVVDLLGGISIDVKEDEVPWMDGYIMENIANTGIESVGVETPGLQVLNGSQALAYARIRYTSGGDYDRTQRQRMVIEKCMEKLKKVGPIVWNQLVDQVLPQVSTNLTTMDFMNLGVRIPFYTLLDKTGFPFDVTTSDEVSGLSGDYVVPIGLSQNVVQLHSYLFGEENYQVSETVQSIDDDIVNLTGISSE